VARRRDPTEFIDLLGAVKKRIGSLASQAYADADLGVLQAKLIRHLGPHSRISQAELARATDSDPTLTGRVLQALIERGLVRRERSDEDRREYVLELSAAGRRIHERVEALRAKVAERMVGVLDSRDLDDLERIANKFLAAFEDPDLTRE
jgi:DNA-binding MarR family transcriptional regulator